MQSDGTDRQRSVGASLATPGPRSVDDPRVYLAVERTFLAWVRTSVALMGFGFLIARFAFWIRESAGQGERTIARSTYSLWLGFGMIIVGVFACVMAAVRHRDYVHALKDGVANPPLHVGSALVVAGILALVGLAIAVEILMR